MVELELTEDQTNVIKQICGMEIEALTIIIEDGPQDESKFIIEQHDTTEEELKEELANMRSEFYRILEEPSLLFQLSSNNISLFRHILFNLEESEDRDEDCVTVIYPEAVKELWRKLFAAEEFKYITDSICHN